ncbi:MAG: polymer-forming cytoskeletal protein [Pseudolabrys sp.]|nr:polymer-forming cytoskeletal protein [Pseudolabrys sp.]
MTVGYLSPNKELNALQFDREPRFEAAPARTQSDIATSFGPGMLITGTVVCAGSMTVSGQVVGDIYATQLTIDEGGRVDGNVVAQDATIRGAFKGTLYGDSVKLQGAALVEGEVYNKSLSIEPDTVFEGVARRFDKPIVRPTMNDVRAKKFQPAEQPQQPQPKQQMQQPAVVDEAPPLDLAPEYIVSPPTGIDYEVIG